MRSLFVLYVFPPLKIRDDLQLDGRHSQPIVITACKNCGFVRLFSSTVFSKWQWRKEMGEERGL
jgi:hypothetical protein